MPQVSFRIVNLWSWLLIASVMSPFCDASAICGVAANQLGEPLKGATITVVNLASSERYVSGDSDAKVRPAYRVCQMEITRLRPAQQGIYTSPIIQSWFTCQTKSRCPSDYSLVPSTRFKISTWVLTRPSTEP